MRPLRMKQALVMLAAAISIDVLPSEASVRGASPEQAGAYAAALSRGSFQCMSGTGTLPASAINDNYCDCTDGSDEPGTSACSSGTFFCRNRGHQPRSLSSSFVDDGICDCCDGTDEPRGTCKQTCAEQGRAARERLLAAAKDAAAGNKVRRQRVRDAERTKAQWTSRLAEVTGQEGELRPVVEKLAAVHEDKDARARVLRERKQAADKAAVDKRKAEEDERKPEADAAAAAASPAAESGEEVAASLSDEGGVAAEEAGAAAGPGVKLDDSPEALAEANRMMQEAAAEQKAQAPAGERQASVAEEQTEAAADQGRESGDAELTDEQRAKATMAQWVKTDDAPPPAAGGAAAGEPAAADRDAGEASGKTNDDHWEDGDEEDGDEEGTDESIEGGPAGEVTEAGLDGRNVNEEEPAHTAAEQTSSLQLRAGLRRLADWAWRCFGRAAKPVLKSELDKAEGDADAAREAHSEKDSKLQELVRERGELEAKLARDYGAGDAFLPLEGRCFTASVDKYQYEVCPYGAAQQKDGGMSTSLGSFARFEDNYATMVFENGQNCWQGPNRSIKLAVTCGAAEVLSAVSEPSRCLYAAKLTTPAMCTKEEQDRLQVAADAAHAELDGIRDEL